MPVDPLNPLGLLPILPATGPKPRKTALGQVDSEQRNQNRRSGSDQRPPDGQPEADECVFSGAQEQDENSGPSTKDIPEDKLRSAAQAVAVLLGELDDTGA